MKNLTKGKLFMGPSGQWKTVNLMLMVEEIKKAPDLYTEERGTHRRTVAMFTARQIAGMIGRKEKTIKQIASYHTLVIDDLGKESKHFGHDVVAEVIETFYDYRFLHRHIPLELYVTTNLTEKEISKRYGEHFMSRLTEMCDIVYIDGEDVRYDNYATTTKKAAPDGSLDLLDTSTWNH